MAAHLRFILCVLALSSLVCLAQNSHSQTRTITADLTQTTGPHSPVPLRVIGAGRANEGLRADWQAQLAFVQREIGFRYIRFHGILHDDMGVYTEDKNGTPEYNFQYVDPLYDALLAHGIRPFVELAFMPAKLASGPQTIFWWKGHVTPPNDPAKWHALIRAFTTHLIQRYGEPEVRQWYFEVWNEPDIQGFWTGSLDDYLALYKNSATAVKESCPTCRVGGPASAIPFAFEIGFEKYLADNPTVPADFISSHAYGVKQGFLDADGTAGTILDPDPNSVSGRMQHSRELLQASSRPNLQLHFTEWSSAYTPTDPMHDQYHQASFILDKVRRATPYVDSLSYWTFTDIFEENGPRFTPFHGGFGLLNLEGIRKPAFFAFRFLRQIDPQPGTEDITSSDPQSWITKSPSGSVQALLWDYSPVVPPKGQTDQSFYTKDLPATPKGTLHLALNHLPDGRYRLATYRVGYGQNDAYTAYLHLGVPRQLTRDQVATLNAASSGQPSATTEVTVRDGSFTQDLPLRSNDIYLLTLTPSK